MTAVSPKRKPAPLAGTRLLVQFAFALGAALAAVFPTRREYAEFANDESPDEYSLAYLRVLTRADPEDMHLHLLYAKHLAKLDRWDDALAADEPVLSDPTLGTEATDLKFDILLARARAIPEGDPTRKAAFHDVATELDVLAARPGTSPDDLPLYAATALELEEPRLAATFYSRAADAGQARRAEYLALAGKWFRAAGDGAQAVDAYEKAANAEKDRARSEDDALAALAVLQGDNHVDAAYDLSLDYLRRFADRLMLERATALASASGRVVDARDLGRRLLAMSPDDPVLIEAQAHRELWAGDPASALPLVVRVRQLRPQDPQVRELEAHVAEWAGKPEMALDDWLWLLSHGVKPK